MNGQEVIEMIRQMDILMSDESNKPAPTGWIIAIDKKLDAFKLVLI